MKYLYQIGCMFIASSLVLCHTEFVEVDLLDKIDDSRRRLVQGDGFWSTKGGKIVDDNGTEIYFSGINWGGFDSENCIVDGLWTGTGRSIQSYLQQMATSGLNLIRLAFAGPCAQPSSYPKEGGVDYEYNQEIKGLSSLEVMQKLVEWAKDVGIRIILDYHRVVPTDKTGAHEDGLWYNEKYPVDYWINTWKNVTRLFKGDPTVVGADVFNEPHNNVDRPGPFWSGNMSDPLNWRAAAIKVGEEIHKIEPRWLICVQGMWDQEAWWGGNLRRVKSLPINLTIPNKVVYQIHDYGPVVYENQSWFKKAEFPDNLVDYWTETWGFVQIENIAPVWIGEFGTFHNITYVSNDTRNSTAHRNYEDLLWFDHFVAYIKKHRFSWTWFTWGPNSRDTGGLLLEDWKTTSVNKLNAIQPIQYPAFSLPGNLSLNAPGVSTPPSGNILAPVAVYFPPPLAVFISPPPPPPTSGGFSLKVNFVVLVGALFSAFLGC